MNIGNKTVLVTGGASGIGLALAEKFLEAGSTVIICGRRESKLQEAKQQHPELHIKVCDVAQATEREELYQWAIRQFPDVNVLINNAGIQRRMSLVENTGRWEEQQQEIVINLEAPVHLCQLFIPHFQQLSEAAFVNVTSGLAFAPAAFAPIYSATKAALHSFTLSLRHQLRNTTVGVVEIVPPAVNTDLGGPGLHTFGVPLNEFTDSVIDDLKNGSQEIGYGFSEKSRNASRQELDALFQQINNR